MVHYEGMNRKFLIKFISKGKWFLFFHQQHNKHQIHSVVKKKTHLFLTSNSATVIAIENVMMYVTIDSVTKENIKNKESDSLPIYNF